MRKKKLLPAHTEEQFSALNGAFKYFNTKPFRSELTGCILNFSRLMELLDSLPLNVGKWSVRKNLEHMKSILPPNALYRTPIEIFSTLDHEICHLSQ